MKTKNRTLGVALALASLITFGCVDDEISDPKTDCGTCPEGQVCNEETGKCETAPEPCGGACSGDLVCNVETGKCELASQPCGGACSGDLVCNVETGKCEIRADAVICPEKQEVCGTICADLTKDSNHCGTCDTVCTGGRQCVDSECKFMCTSEETACEEGCYNLKTDKLHCGACSTKCEEDQVCVDGVCGLSCNLGEIACGANCVDLLSDSENCGECERKCETGETCQKGTCQKECQAGTVLCGSECIDLDSSDTCGTSCDNYKACDASKTEACILGVCKVQCKTEQILCNNNCVDINSDKNNCGGCGDAFKCADGEKCNAGTCSKDCGELVDCNGNCIDPQSHPDYCGATEACSDYSVCGEGLSCQSGECQCTDGSQTMCKAGEGAVCTDPNTSTQYCGCNAETEGLDCSAVGGITEGVCENGVCKITCDETHANCDDDVANGCEANLTSVESCGACGVVCADENASNVQCLAGTCQYVCKEGMAFCDGKCSDVSKDNNNCGACGRQCAEGASCQNGFCTIDPSKCDEDGYVTTVVNNREIKAYCIKTESAFFDLRDRINTGRPYPDDNNKQNAYILMDNLVFGEQNAWIPVGTASNPFRNGVFLGNGKKLQGTFTAVGGNNGLFGQVNDSNFYDFDAEIQMVNTGATYWNGCLIGYAINSELGFSKVTGSNLGYYGTGIAVGRADSSTISHVSASGKLRPSYHDCGGIVGYVLNSTIEYCTSDIDMEPQPNSPWNGTYGGLAGYVADNTKILHSSASGLININNPASKSAVGGLVGFVRNNVSIQNCSASTVIKESNPLSHQGIGGLIGGFCETGAPCLLENSYATGDVECKSMYCGGLVGYVYPVGSKIKNCYATGKVSGSQGNVGGLIGVVDSNTTISDVYATGDVSAEGTQVGGLIGFMQYSTLTNARAEGNVFSDKVNALYMGGAIGKAVGSTISNIYARGNVSGYGAVGGVIGEIYATSLTNSGAFGTVTCNVYGNAKGIYAGGLLGTVVASSSVTNGFATGNVTCGEHVGAAIGHFNIGNNSVRSVYGTGIVSGIANSTGAFGGIVYGGTLSLKNSYYWLNSHDKIIGVGGPIDTTASAFIYNESKEAVLSMNNSRKLTQSLGDDWVSATCKLKDGPKDTVTIPVLKVFGADICE